MTFFLILALTALLLSAATLRELFHDGRGPAAPPTSHPEDLRFRAPRVR